MRQKLFPILTLAIMMFFGACSNEELIEQTNPAANMEGRKLSLTASMPGDDTTTRVALEEKDNGAIALTWQTTDELQLAFVQGENKVKSTATVSSVSPDGKKAAFDIVIPNGIDPGTLFDIYGVYGGGGLDDENPTNVILPTLPDQASSLAEVQTRKDVMLSFKSEGVDATKPQVSATFEHLGSLFCINLKNVGTENLENLSGARLVGVGGGGDWAYNSGVGGGSYDLETKEFQNIETAGNHISFNTEIGSLPADSEMTFWSWNPPLPDKNWPELKLQLRDETTALVTSNNTKSARNTPTAAGMTYYFYAEWDGSALALTDPPLGADEYYIAEMGTLVSVIGSDNMESITRMILKGQINSQDFLNMRGAMTNLTYLDLSQVICDGNEIPEYAFGGFTAIQAHKNIATIILPTSITSIGKEAFRKCTGLTGELAIPAKVTTIEREAFNGCVGLTGLTLPASLTTIELGAFAFCTGLSGDLIIPNKVTSIGAASFRDCTGFTGTLTLPDGLKKIEGHAFYKTRFTGSLTLPKELTELLDNAFSGNTGFTGSLTIPDKVTTIGYGAFSNCDGFTGNLTIPDKVTSIGSSAFSGCTGFAGTLSLSDGLATIGSYAFNNCANIFGPVVFPSTLTSIGIYGFSECTNVAVFQFPHAQPISYTNEMLPSGKIVKVPAGAVAKYEAADGWKNHTFETFTNNYTVDVETMGILSSLLSAKQKENITNLTVVGKINAADFEVMKKDMPNLTYLDLEDVTCEGDKIPDSAFGYSNITGVANTSITTIVLPESITTIGISAFQSCEGLSGTLNIPNGVTTIESSAFYGCKGFTGNLTLPDGITTIGEFAFYLCSGLNGSLIIPDKITAIQASAFRSCSGFTGSLVIPNNVTNIGDYVFNNCKGFTDLTLSDNLTTIGSNAFSYCDKIAGTVVFPATLTSIGSKGFYASYKITTFQFLGETVVPYTNQMFVSEKSKTIQVPSNVLETYKAASGWSTYPGTIVGY